MALHAPSSSPNCTPSLFVHGILWKTSPFFGDLHLEIIQSEHRMKCADLPKDGAFSIEFLPSECKNLPFPVKLSSKSWRFLFFHLAFLSQLLAFRFYGCDLFYFLFNHTILFHNYCSLLFGAFYSFFSVAIL